MPKQTRLGEDAEIYQPRREQSEKEKLSDMTFRNKLAYLWMYYRIQAFATIVAVALAGYIVYTIVTPDIKTQFYAAIINNTIHTETLDQLTIDFSNYLQIDPKIEKVDINSGFYFNADGEYAMNMRQALTTYVSAQEIDVIIAPESEFKNFAYYGYFNKLSDQLPTDVYSDLTDYFYMSDQEDSPERNVYGIYLTESDLFKKNANNKDPYILGIVANSKHPDNTVDFIKYLFQLQ
jgi:hypothetical protein